MKNKILLSLLVIFAVVLSTGVAYASTPFGEPDSSISVNSVESGLSSRFVLEDSSGLLWNLNIAHGCVLYGTMHHSEVWPAYGFIFGDEMVLWADGPGTDGWVDSIAYTGMWDFATMTYTGKWVNYYDGTGGSGDVSMWLYGASGAEIETGPNPLIAQSGAALDTQDSGMTPAGVASDEMTATELDIQSPFGVLTDRGALCYEDWYGCIWDLDLAFGCLYYGSVEGYPAYGFIFDDEAFYWANYGVGSFVYTGEWVTDTLYTGTWVNTTGSFDTVELWPCGGGETEYYAVISGNGWNCEYADDDAYDAYDVLTSYGNWDPANIKLLVSTADGSVHDCTKTNIQNEIAWMASQSDDDDVCVFWYSGHGGYMVDVDPYDESDGYDEYICPEGGNILDDELTTWMLAINGSNLVALDSCFSGGFIKAGDDLISRSAPDLPRALITDSFREDLTLAGFNVHTACDEDESAYGSGALQNGVFTYYFVQGLYGQADSNSDGVVDALEAHYYTRPLVRAYMGGIQNPKLWYGTDEPLIWVE